LKEKSNGTGTRRTALAAGHTTANYNSADSFLALKVWPMWQVRFGHMLARTDEHTDRSAAMELCSCTAINGSGITKEAGKCFPRFYRLTHLAPHWSVAELALQCGVGLRAWWRARHGPCGCCDSCAIGENIVEAIRPSIFWPGTPRAPRPSHLSVARRARAR
jgi:hypothetical protein